MCLPLLASICVPRQGRGRPRKRPKSVTADKAYSSRAIRSHLRTRGIATAIPEPADQAGHRLRRGSAGGRPPAFDDTAYKGRNIIERAFAHIKQWRGSATRYDKHSIIYRTGLILASIMLWLRSQGDTP